MQVSGSKNNSPSTHNLLRKVDEVPQELKKFLQSIYVSFDLFINKDSM